MKKSKILLFVLIIVSLLSSNVLASSLESSNDYFCIDIPEGYKNSSSLVGDKSLYTFSKDNSSSIVIEVSNRNADGKATSFSNNSLEAYVDGLYKGLNEQYKNEIGSEVEVINRETTYIGNQAYTASMIQLKYDENNLYQQFFVIFSDNYIYNVCITSYDENFLISTELKSIKDSFEIKDTITMYYMDNSDKNIITAGRYTGIGIGVIAIVVLCVILVKKSYSKK
ncbi:MAG: hypothetical protein FWF46_01840 [Oscillospiraceae bacterium]|nr:hypothetical protein [Oscillospiraceae bacterium]